MMKLAGRFHLPVDSQRFRRLPKPMLVEGFRAWGLFLQMIDVGEIPLPPGATSGRVSRGDSGVSQNPLINGHHLHTGRNVE